MENNNVIEKNHREKIFDAKTIRHQTNDIKLKFIKNVIGETEIPVNFKPTWKTNSIRNIFYRIKDGIEEKREWVLLENNYFYCAYCLCFALKEHRFAKGVEYVKSGRITDSLNKHDEESYHKHAVATFLKLNADSQVGSSQSDSSKRTVLRAIIKIIIFIATHGK